MASCLHRHGSAAGLRVGFGGRPRELGKSSSRESVAVLTADDYVAVYELGGKRECLKTWSVQSSTGRKKKVKKLVGAAVSVPGTSTMMVLTEKNAYYAWDFFQESPYLEPTAAQGLGKQEEAFTILCDRHLLGMVVIVLTDGTIKLFNQQGTVSEANFADTRSETVQVLAASIVECNRRKAYYRIFLVEAVTKGKKTTQRVRAVEIIGTLLKAGMSYQLDDSSKGKRQVVSLTALSSRYISVFFDDGVCQSLCLDRSRPDLVRLVSEASFPFGDNNNNNNNKVVVAAAQAGFPLVYLGACPGALSLWNVQLGVLVSEWPTPSTLLSISVLDEWVLLSLANGDVLIDSSNASQGRLTLGSSAESGSLATALKATSMATRMTKGGLEGKGGDDQDDDDEKGLLVVCPVIDCSEESTMFSQQGFKRKLKDAETETNQAIASLTKKRKNTKTTQLKGDSEGAIALVQGAPLAVSHVVKKCVELQEWQRLRELLETRQVSSATNPELLQTLIKHHQIELLYACVLWVVDLQEVAVVSLIKFIVQGAHQGDLEKFAHWFEKKIKGKSGIDKDRLRAIESFKRLDAQARGQQYFLMGLMCTPRNELFFVQAAQALRPEICLVLVRSIAGLLLFYGLQPNRRVRFVDATATGALAVPTFEQTLDVMIAMLDASFRKILAVDTDVRTKKLLKTVLKVVAAHGRICSELSEMRVPLAFSLRQDKRLEPVQPASGYLIEEVLL